MPDPLLQPEDGRSDPTFSPSSSKTPFTPYTLGPISRVSQRVFEVIDASGDQLFDIGQIKEYVIFDGYLRQRPTGSNEFRPVPSGYPFFAAKFNEHAQGSERFATFFMIDTTPIVGRQGTAMSFDLFEIDDSLVGFVERHYESVNPETLRRRRELEQMATKLKDRIKAMQDISAYLNAKSVDSFLC